MIWFLLKKFLFDLWDNLFFIALLNLGFLLFLALGIVLLSVLPTAPLILFFCYWFFVYFCAAVSVLMEASDYQRPNPADFIRNIKSALLPAAVFFSAAAFVFVVIRFTIPIYLKMETLMGLAAAFFSCWICLFITASIQFYPAVYYRLGKRPLKSIKKCAIIFLDNTLFCLFTLFFSILLSIYILPFPGFPLLFLDEALRLRLLKYDWLETHSRKTKIPWHELLAEEKENTGHRTLKSFIFPWH